MNTKYIISLTALVALSGALSYGAASNPNPETPIGSLALLYAEGSADQAPRILALASLDKKKLLELARIGCKEPQRFPMLYRDAMRELYRQKEKFKQFLQVYNGDVRKALFDAARNDKTWAIDYLVQNGADLNAKDNGGWTALMLAANEGHEAVVAQLIAARADLNVKNNCGQTALMYAAGRGHEAVVAQLIAVRVNVDARDNNDRTALIFAAMDGYEATAAQLIAARADFNVKDKDGNTALMYAVKNNREATAKLLIEAGLILQV